MAEMLSKQIIMMSYTQHLESYLKYMPQKKNKTLCQINNLFLDTKAKRPKRLLIWLSVQKGD